MFAPIANWRVRRQIVPGEPAAWANWGVLALRQRNFDPAGQRLERARKLAPQNDAIDYLLGLLESGRGNSAEAIADFRKAVDINPNNLIATYRLAEEIERQGDPNSDATFQAVDGADRRMRNPITWPRCWNSAV